MYELGSYVSNGTHSAIFRIRDQPKLCVKISFVNMGGGAKKSLESELKVAEKLKKLGVNVLMYGDVIQIKIPDYIAETFQKKSKSAAFAEWDFGSMKAFFISMKGQVVWGLVMEYVGDDIIILQKKQIDTMISNQRIKYIYDKELEKLNSLGISWADSGSGLNVIWSESRAKLYFIDFEWWNIPWYTFFKRL